MIAVVDYGVNNLRSVVRALEAGGHRASLTRDPDEVRTAERVLLPGVGNFGQGTRNLTAAGLGGAVREAAVAGRPVMGICLGLQLLFETSEEAADARGLGLLPGRVRRFATTQHVPHVGWARVDLTEAGRAHPMLGPLFGGEPRFFYHVHSYHPSELPVEAVLGTGDYGGEFPTLVGQGNVVGAQFHPEKSQRAGIELLDAFARWSP
ncbi:MAG TPA: imidazole glycerol phosphate synthase subunit HisH [Gemmatimonadales bacterium]|nr:imidazole glycerol phosphate synthase subunit HisH [Gemmatimonadales bacterium]